MWTYNYTNELYHHGVKGMKWGHRRALANVTTGNSRSKGGNGGDSDAARAERRAKRISTGKKVAAGLLVAAGAAAVTAVAIDMKKNPAFYDGIKKIVKNTIQQRGQNLKNGGVKRIGSVVKGEFIRTHSPKLFDKLYNAPIQIGKDFKR